MGSFVPCSPKHKNCSPAHAALVRDYRAERERQEVLNDRILNNREEKRIWFENFNRLVTFRDWLLWHKE
ncbi:hypothetical protein SEA_LABELLE_70 [Mycobacterium phage Labelle]|nr:hypothetical protein SEA_LABELLE_70 [Mycobacterium phage Labelle]